MVDTKGPSHLLLVFARKFEEFAWEVENKHLVWLQEIEEEARRMFSSDFSAEPELMPKTPSQKKRRKKVVTNPNEDQELNGKRLSRRRRISNNWAASVRRLSVKLQNKQPENSIIEEEAQPRRVTRAQAQAQMTCPVAERIPQEPSIVPLGGCFSAVTITASDNKSAENRIPKTEDQVEEIIVLSSGGEESPKKVEAMKSLSAKAASEVIPETPEVKERGVTKVKLAHTSTPKQEEMKATEEKLLDLSTVDYVDAKGPEMEQVQDLSHQKGTPTGSKSDRRSVRRSLVGRPSKSRRISLVDQYSLASRRESMTREAVRKSIRKSISKKRAAMESSASSYVSCSSSTEIVDDDDIADVRPQMVPSSSGDEASNGPRRSLRLRSAKKIVISNLTIEPEQRRVTHQTLAQEEKTEQEKEKEESEEQTQTARRKQSYKRAVDEQYDGSDEQANNAEGPPPKKTPSPPCPANKVVQPSSHMRGFLHTVQKNQLLMTPCSIGRNIVMKSFIKRNTPLKVDPKRLSNFDEKERQRQENLRKKEEAELLRKQKVEEEKKRKLDELKLRREERLRKVLQARERAEQIEEERKKKIEQKFAHIGEKNEKVREDRIAKEKAKRKVTAKIMEDMELRRRQEEEARKQKQQQMEEEERKHEMIQKKKDEEEQERMRKITEAKKQAEQERQREQQIAERELERKKEQERVQAERERERQEKEKAMQLQRELERAAHEKAVAQEKERLQKEMEERKRKERERQEKLQEERRLQEEQEKRAKEKQLAIEKPLNVTIEVKNTPAPTESYQMTPQGQNPKPPKIYDENYGMDLNSDDSTDDESQPRKPIPSWATGTLLNQTIRHQYYNPVDIDSRFGKIESPKLEDIFYKSKPRYFKRTSSAVWHSPPLTSNRINLPFTYGLKKY